MERRKKIIIIIAIAIAVILLAVIFVLVAKGNKAAKEKEQKAKEQEVVKNTIKEKEEKEEKEEETPEEKEEQPEEQKEFQKVSYDLKNKEEEFKVDNNLTIKFVGTKEDYSTDTEEYYTYNANIYYKGVLVKTKMFNAIDNRVIYSSNHAATFYVDKKDKVYIIVANVAKQTDGNYVVFLNEKGQVLREFEDVSLEINDNLVTVNITTEKGVETGSTKVGNTTFKIQGNELNIVYEN